MGDNNVLRRGLVKVLVAAIRAYQVLFSQLFAGSCRFVPSCSSYAREAVERHGPLKGTWLALARLARCHPLCSAGLDQVPGVEGTDGA